MKLMVMPVGRSLVFELQLSQTLHPILKRFAGRLARYANIDILKTSSAEEENILASVALPYVVTLGHPIPPFLYPSLG